MEMLLLLGLAGLVVGLVLIVEGIGALKRYRRDQAVLTQNPAVKGRTGVEMRKRCREYRRMAVWLIILGLLLLLAGLALLVWAGLS